MSDNNEKFQIINKEKISSATMKGMEKVSHGLVKGFDKSSKVITSASKELVKAKEIIVKKGKDTQGRGFVKKFSPFGFIFSWNDRNHRKRSEDFSER